MNHLLKLSDLSSDEIVSILNLADQLKYERKNGIAHRNRRAPVLRQVPHSGDLGSRQKVSRSGTLPSAGRDRAVCFRNRHPSLARRLQQRGEQNGVSAARCRQQPLLFACQRNGVLDIRTTRSQRAHGTLYAVLCMERCRQFMDWPCTEGRRKLDGSDPEARRAGSSRLYKCRQLQPRCRYRHPRTGKLSLHRLWLVSSSRSRTLRHSQRNGVDQ